MKSHDEDRGVLDGQQRHWEKVYAGNEDMFGKGPSYPARRAAGMFREHRARKVLELGSGQGRDTLFFALQGFHVYSLDYSAEGLSELQRKAEAMSLSSSVTTVRHDVRVRLPFEDDSFDGCYSHMLYCMALTTRELEFVSGEIRRVLKPGGLNIYTVRHTADPHYGTGIDRGDDMREIGGGFIVHFFSRQKVQDLAKGYEIVDMEEFEETALPRRLYLVVLRKSP